MAISINFPLIQNEFILENQEPGLTKDEIKSIVDEIQTNLKEHSLLSGLKMSYDFYLEGQKYLETVYPKMIELGAITESQIAEQKKNSPNTEGFELDDFLKYLEPPFVLMLSEENPKKKGTFGITVECSWDPEHGLGIWFENWIPIEAGFAEVAYR